MQWRGSGGRNPLRAPNWQRVTVRARTSGEVFDGELPFWQSLSGLSPVNMSEQPLKHVKLSFKDDRIVLPVATKTGKIASLLAEATVRFRAQRLLEQDDSFIQISTIDGYTISPNDSIEDIISNGDHLVLQNRAAWIANFTRNNNATYWYASSLSPLLSPFSFSLHPLTSFSA